MIKPFELDEDFEYFLEKLGSPTDQKSCVTETINKYTGKLPDRLLAYWQEYGFCGFNNGLFWIVNPDDFEDTLDEWLEHTDIPDQDIYHVFARNAFGDLFLWGEETGYKYEITARRGWVIEKKGKPRSEHNIAIEWFFGGANVDDHDIDNEHGKPLFDKCVKKFGALQADEMFGFEPSLIVGGESQLTNINKVNIDIHLSILAQFGQVEVLDRDALIRKAF